jgi:hypothetical protein
VTGASTADLNLAFLRTVVSGLALSSIVLFATGPGRPADFLVSRTPRQEPGTAPHP